MQKTNVTYLKQQIQSVVVTLLAKTINVAWADIKFQIAFDESEKQPPKSNWDEMMLYHILPKKIGCLLTLEEVAETLTTATNEIPLFIKIKQLQPLKLYKLSISKRFRKLAEIEKHHKYNPASPIIIE